MKANGTYVESKLHLGRPLVDLEHGHIAQLELVLDIAIVVLRLQVVVRRLVGPVVLDVLELVELRGEGDELLVFLQL